jgi:hypothetical protein
MRLSKSYGRVKEEKPLIQGIDLERDYSKSHTEL